MRVEDTLPSDRTVRASRSAPEQSRARQQLGIAVCCWCVVVLSSVIAFTVPRFHVPRIDAGFNPSTVVVGAGHELIQTFRMKAQGLDEVDFDIVEASPDTAIVVDVGVRQGVIITVLHQQTLSLPAGRHSVSLTFAPRPTDKDLVYTVRIRPLGSEKSAHITLRTTEGHTYQEGAIWLDGVELPLDLVMRVDAQTAQPWRAAAAMIQARTGRKGIEWGLAAMYLAAVFVILRGLAEQ